MCKNCHAKIEDEVVFPELRKSPDAMAIKKTISVEGDLDILNKRILEFN